MSSCPYLNLFITRRGAIITYYHEHRATVSQQLKLFSNDGSHIEKVFAQESR